jgi:outer membrane beta-barrel protein
LALGLNSRTSQAEEQKETKPAADSAKAEPDLEQVNVDNIKERYWARGNETELGVVQNRAYSKTGKVEFGLLGGVDFSDPFLTLKHLGLDAGYHLSEYISLHILYWKYFVGNSDAELTFEQYSGATANTNKPSYYLGTELDGSMLYGKLSVLGQSIIYYDLHLLGGLGLTNTESGTYFTPHLGVGQRFYLSKILSLRVDYRLDYFRETIFEKQIVTKLGQSVGQRDNFTNTITLGLSLMI